MPDPQPIPIVDVTLPEVAQQHVRERRLEQVIASAEVPPGKEAAKEEVAQWLSQLAEHQQNVLLDALDHSLGDGHTRDVSFSKQKVGFKLDGVLLSVTDRTVAEESTTAPIAVRFIYKG
jgi:hypothetical protein